jgi:trans-aconitate methyltransferase
LEITTLENLENISKKSLYSAGVMQYSIAHSFNILSRYANFINVLELGPAEGVMTHLLSHRAQQLTLVEGSQLFCGALSNDFPDACVIHSLFETFEPVIQFDTIVMGHVLEHVDDPVALLKRVKNWLTPNGIVFCSVPNAMSVHRQAAVIMGLLETESALNDLDRHHGHKRVYYPELLRQHFIQAGFGIDSYGGYWLKALSNKQLEAVCDESMINGFMLLGERYPDISAEIYVVAR